MIYWNPLYKVSMSREAIHFADERGTFSLVLPVECRDCCEILWALPRGLNWSEFNRATESEQKMLAILAKKRLIIDLPAHPSVCVAERSIGHYATFHPAPTAALKKLRSATVCILGLGGVGSVVLQHLVAMGIGRYFLVDSDRVEASNLNRQLIYSPIDIGRLKTEAAKAFVHSRIPGSQVSSAFVRIQSPQCLEKLPVSACDFVVHCLDTPRDTIDSIVYGFGSDRKIPVITSGVGVHFGHWGPLIVPGSTISYENWKRLYTQRPRRHPQEAFTQPTPWSFGPTNTLIAASVARDVAEWLGGRHDVASLGARLVQRFSDNLIVPYGSVAMMSEVLP